VFCENQYGFRRHRSTTDCMFILHGIIELILNKSKPVYCAFIDLQRAFDSVNRRAMWFNLHHHKVSTKMTNLMQSMYSKMKLCVKNTTVNDILSDRNRDTFFTSKSGVFQGECLSAFLFAMFINDLDDFLQSKDNVGITLEQWLLTVLLFADDMVVFSESRMGLQNGLNALGEYCAKWGLSVNVQKTKCVAFRQGGRIGALDKWTYNNQPLETVKHFKYLGFVFGSSGKFSKGIQALAEQGQRALFSLKSLFHQQAEMATATQLKLFNALVSPILNYSCEIWGFCEATQHERLCLGFLKSVLGVRRAVPNAFIYSEFGIFPLIIGRQKRIVKYWLKILSLNENNPVKIVYKLLLKDIEENVNRTNWASLLKSMLEKCGFGDAWLHQCTLNEDRLLSQFSQRVQDMYLQQRHDTIHNVSDNRLYKYLSPPMEGARYLFDVNERYIRTAISKLRLGSHNFMIERGKWHCPKLEIQSRTCEACNRIEDEYHILLECKRFDILRIKYVPKILIQNPSMYKFLNFINNAEGKNLKRFGIFCYKIFIEYNNSVM